ncbi:3-beta hydroxysteroid dehydrogenase/isomerase family protein-like protein [Lentithecium fluviatile CBS 122367]|uniref:3-beta hydroxysteroid dehydrogenase/isomerase family protein-like protein n=1 Tax=Lentithecium fluviatile CBS 122367 TaxID=1168545 RepID=A0A6G1IQX5_9PLEO|nr:3-beta hydroxysteroid dehydrogenase/isomerase family protein-like protein [Lentithecium fluviatile CBS 122367]
MAPAHRILLTGANGYIATHILKQLLSSPAQHSVRAVVRSLAKVDDVKVVFPDVDNKRLDFAIVPDMTVKGAFDDALESDPPFDIVMHTASPFLYKAAGSAKDFLEPAVKGTTEVLEGIQRITPATVTRVILTSSFAAIGAFGQVDESNKIYNEDDWNPVTLEVAEKSDDNKNLAYLASKKFAEQAAWEVQKRESVNWDLVSLNPPMVYGPLAHKPKSLSDLNESTARLWNLFLKEKNPEGALPPNGVHLYVDVRDIARAHVLAMDAPSAGNQRFITTADPVDSQKIADIMRAEVPGAAERVPKGEPGTNTLPADAYGADASKAERILGLKWRPVEETFANSARQLLEFEKGNFIAY